MNAAEIIAELPNLTHEDRRRILDRIQEVEEETEEAEELARLANESFQTLSTSNTLQVAGTTRASP